MSTPERPPAGGESRRRSPRVTAQVPLEVSFEGVTVGGRSAVVNRHGALILCGINCPDGVVIEVKNKTTGEAVACRVVWCGSEIVDAERKLGIEMLEDRPDFWALDFEALAKQGWQR